MQAELNLYANAVKAGDGLKSVTAKRSSYGQFLEIRRWLLDDPVARSKESAWKPTEIMKLLPKPLPSTDIDPQIGLTKKVMLRGVKELRNAWKMVPGIQIETSTIAILSHQARRDAMMTAMNSITHKWNDANRFAESASTKEDAQLFSQASEIVRAEQRAFIEKYKIWLW